jgi:hypothetical protein
MIRQRPTSILVIAILGIFVGLHWTCCSGLGIALEFPWLPPSLGGAQESEAKAGGQIILMRQPLLKVVNWIRYLFELTISLTLIVMGIALLRLWPWARPLSIACGWLILLGALAGTPLTVWEWVTEMSELRNSPDAETQHLAGFVEPFYIAQLFMISVWFAFGLGLLIVARRTAFREAFQSHSADGAPSAQSSP